MKELSLCADETMDTRTIVARRTPEVWGQHERDGHMPKFPDCPVCVQEHGSVVKHFSSTTNSLQGYWGDPSLDGKRYFVAAGLRVQHEDKVMLVPFFFPVENKNRLTVSQEVFQLVDYIATCKQLQAFHGSRVLRILSDQGTEFVNQDFEKQATQRGIHSTAKQRCCREACGSRKAMHVPFAPSCRASRLILELRHAICCRNAST